MGSYEHDTQQTNPAGKNNHAATDVADTQEVKNLKTQYKNELNTLQELFANWTEADLLFALQEASGDLEVAVNRISEGHTTQWGEVKSRKSKKEHNHKAKASGQQPGSSRGHQRGGHSDRGRPRGEGGFRGGRNDRSRGPRKENGSGYTRPPRQQNGPSSNHDDTSNGAHSKWGTENASGNWGNNEGTGGDLNGNSNESWSDSKGPAWSTENNATNDWSADNPTQGSWSNDNAADNNDVSLENDTSTDKGQNSRTIDVHTEHSQVVLNDNDTINNSGGWTTESTTENAKDNWVTDNKMDNLGVNRESDKSTENSKHLRESNIVKENNNTRDTDNSKDSWGNENSRTSDTPKENWGSEASKNGKNIRDAQKSPKPGASRSITAVKSPVPHKSRTIPSQPKASWAQIVKPELKPEPKPEPVSAPIHKSSPEMVKSVSPQISKSPSIPVQSSPKVPEPISVPSQETLAPVITVVKTEEIKESIKEIPSPEQSTTTPATSSPVASASPRTKEISPPGLLYKSKTGAPTRRLKQDAAVVMPSVGAGLERVGVQFGSLSISNVGEEITEIETPASPPVQNIEETSQHSQPPATPVQQPPLQQPSTQQQATNTINRSIPTSSTQSSALQSSVSSVPPSTPLTTVPTPPQNFNPSYFKQQQEQPTSAAYLNQQHHIGLAGEPLSAPYSSYLHSQPPNQLSGFGIGPMQSLPDYGALYGPEAQRVMGYYADPSYGQASPSTGYQNRDNNKYNAPDTTTNSSQSSTQQNNTQQQSTNQQGQNPQQPYPVGVPYYPYYYLPSYQQSGYGQPFVNKSMYPVYNHPHSTKPGSASGATPYGYPSTPTTPNAPHHYSHTSTTGYEDITAGQMHHLPGVPNVHEYKAYGGGGIPPLNFLGSTAGNTPQPASGTTGSTASSGKAGNNGSSELNSPAQYKGYGDKTSTAAQQTGVGQSGVQQHQQQQPTNPNYYGQQQAQQMFNSYQYPQPHHQYHPHQAHHQATGRNQQYWSNQS
ncbi:9845_t:CDS:2 [Acaulospora colombiana]|uniref:9845_t:CDS:1 n=1 Tax=Acaulospora colombiana TaxID=27376 RepID=A0ACA9K0H2_9GLOM|nr:9845_t:CDS:2 [Acaulospora colombiana]